MAKNVLILDVGIAGSYAKGELNHHYCDMAKELLESKGYSVTVSNLDQPFDIKEEADKIIATDFVLVQFPGYWMSAPWQLKRYFDEVFMDERIVCGGDGRHRGTDAKYGTGGVLTDKKYMLSSTWNTPLTALNDPDEFYHGVGIDGLLMPIHKTFQFIGMKPLPSFMVADVLKNPTHEQDFARFKEHINANF